jgi:hypothetical protein
MDGRVAGLLMELVAWGEHEGVGSHISGLPLRLAVIAGFAKERRRRPCVSVEALCQPGARGDSRQY